jgi:hypothetical protein
MLNAKSSPNGLLVFLSLSTLASTKSISPWLERDANVSNNTGDEFAD